MQRGTSFMDTLQLKPSAVRVALTGGVISGGKIELLRGLDALHLQSGAQNCQRVKYLAQTCNKKKCLALAAFFARLRALLVCTSDLLAAQLRLV
jgi:hypothetical protein